MKETTLHNMYCRGCDDTTFCFPNQKKCDICGGKLKTVGKIRALVEGSKIKKILYGVKA